jgi:hypothetical protein
LKEYEEMIEREILNNEEEIPEKNKRKRTVEEADKPKGKKKKNVQSEICTFQHFNIQIKLKTH